MIKALNLNPNKPVNRISLPVSISTRCRAQGIELFLFFYLCNLDPNYLQFLQDLDETERKEDYELRTAADMFLFDQGSLKCSHPVGFVL